MGSAWAARTLAALLLALGAAGGTQDLEGRFRAALEAEGTQPFELYVGGELAARRAMAAWAANHARPAHLEGLLATLVREHDALARRSLVEALGALLPLEGAAAERRAAALAERALEDSDPALRGAALVALGTAGGRPAARELDALLERLPPAEALAAARVLVDLQTEGDVLVARVLAQGPREPGTAGSPRALPPQVLALLLPAYGRALADPARPPATARERAPLTRALRDPSPSVRRAGAAGIVALVRRHLVLRQPGRAERVLLELAGEGRDPQASELERARLLLGEGLDAQRALSLALGLGGPGTLGEGRGAIAVRVGARHLAGIAALALDRPGEAADWLARAAELQDERLAERLDAFSEGGAREQEERLEARAAIELARALGALAQGRSGADRSVLEPLRLAHELILEAQALAARGEGRELGHWEGVLAHELSPTGLLLARPRPGWPLARAHDLLAALGAALATVAPGEFPGFMPFDAISPELADPLEDPRRLRRLAAILEGRLARLRQELVRLRREVLERDGLEGLQEPEVASRLRDLLYERMEYERWKGALAEHAHKLRTPTRLALNLSAELLGDGRSAAARELAQRLLADLEREAGALLWAEELAAQAEMSIGSTWMQDDEPRRAEQVLESAVERYENLERTLIERGVDAALLAGLRRERASALMSLAVNTNVRLKDPERALGFFERAYELRQDDFMRVLLACYRARMGRAAEARSLLDQVQVAPALYYNLACTYALLGEGRRALELLELDFATNHDSPGSLEQQKRWAASDPDLASLREDARFRWLVGEGANESREGR